MTIHEKERLNDYMYKVQQRAQHFIGYPIATDFNYSDLYPLLQYPLNNVGDPLLESTYDLNSRSLEREVVQFFAELFRAPKENHWGYVTNGGSEGNLYGLYVARELYPQGMVYYSEAMHYSVQKNIHLLNMPSIVIRSMPNGEMDYDDLEDNVGIKGIYKNLFLPLFNCICQFGTANPFKSCINGFELPRSKIIVSNPNTLHTVRDVNRTAVSIQYLL